MNNSVTDSIESVISNYKDYKPYLEKLTPEFFNTGGFIAFFKMVTDAILEVFNNKSYDKLYELTLIDKDLETFKNLICVGWEVESDKSPVYNWSNFKDSEKKIDFYLDKEFMQQSRLNQLLGKIKVVGWMCKPVDNLTKSATSKFLTFETELLFSYDQMNGTYLLPKFIGFVSL